MLEDIQNFRDSVGALVAELEAAQSPDPADNLPLETYVLVSGRVDGPGPQRLISDVPGYVLAAVRAERDAYQAELEKLKMARLELNELRHQSWMNPGYNPS